MSVSACFLFDPLSLVGLNWVEMVAVGGRSRVAGAWLRCVCVCVRVSFVVWCRVMSCVRHLSLVVDCPLLCCALLFCVVLGCVVW